MKFLLSEQRRIKKKKIRERERTGGGERKNKRERERWSKRVRRSTIEGERRCSMVWRVYGALMRLKPRALCASIQFSFSSVVMVGCWLSGDIFKTIYFIAKAAPFQVRRLSLILTAEILFELYTLKANLYSLSSLSFTPSFMRSLLVVFCVWNVADLHRPSHSLSSVCLLQDPHPFITE